MKTIEVTLYEYEELSERAQERALTDYMSHGNDFDMREPTNTLNKFESIFPIKIRDWEFGGGQSAISFRFTGSEDIENLTGWRLATYIWNNYRDYIYSHKYYSTRGCWIDGKYHYKSRRSNIIICSEDCPLTGTCYDNDILDPIWKFLKKPDETTTFESLLDDCLQSWLNECEKEDEYRSSKEAFAETCEANEWLFTKEGKQWY